MHYKETKNSCHGTYRLKSAGNLLYYKQNELFKLLVGWRENHLIILAHQFHTKLRQIVFVGFIKQINPCGYCASQDVLQLNMQSYSSPSNLFVYIKHYKH